MVGKMRNIDEIAKCDLTIPFESGSEVVLLSVKENRERWTSWNNYHFLYNNVDHNKLTEQDIAHMEDSTEGIKLSH